ncbi:hypothetical protein NPIL_463131 [Nephila pilipes]|uniref:Uncharacterized protein n=1 Tax=Nephila pilipes TaxID=299642 RepID=A0A8X6NR99_NEPPI|nr:hypothetical protein NPIL_463131 [Nephila pilipes]
MTNSRCHFLWKRACISKSELLQWVIENQYVKDHRKIESNVSIYYIAQMEMSHECQKRYARETFYGGFFQLT